MNSIPKITKNLLYINVIVFIAQFMFEKRGIDLADYLGLHFCLADNFNVLQLFTYMFLHGGWEHLFFNMFALWMFGRTIELAMGTKHFLIYYIVCGVGAGFCQELVQFAEYYLTGLNNYELVNMGNQMVSMSDYLSLWTTIGASGAVYGILLAFGFLFPNERIMLLIPPIPMRAKYFVMGYAALELILSFNNNDNIAHFAHLGGMIFGLLLLLRWTRMRTQDQWWDKLKKHFSTPKHSPKMNVYRSPQYVEPKPVNEQEVKKADDATTAEREAKKKRVEQLLDKIKISGYESLTQEEKAFLFSISTPQTKQQED
jgi:membrane associated rhomboid family serine protease